MRVEHQKPKPASDWMGCPKKEQDVDDEDNEFDPNWGTRKIGYDDSLNPNDVDNDPGAASSLRHSYFGHILTVLVLLYFRRYI